MFKKLLIFIIAAIFLSGCSASQTRETGDEIVHGLGEVGDFTQDVADDVQEAFGSGYNTDQPSRRVEREHVRWMAENCHVSEADIRGLRKNGLGWNAIAQKYNLRPEPGCAPMWANWR